MALIMAFIPTVSIAGASLGCIFLIEAIRSKDKLTKVLSIAAMIVGIAVTIYVRFY